MENSKQQMRRKKEDAALNKLLIWFGVAIVYEAIALLLKRFYTEFRTEAEINFAYGLSQAFRILQWVLPVLTVAALIWGLLNWKKGKELRAPMICTGVGLLLSFTIIMAYHFFDTGVMILGVIAPVLAVLALVYYLYQKEFFCNTLLAGGGIFALWMYRRFYLLHPRWITAGFVLGWILLAAAVCLAWQLSKTKGKWKNYTLFSAKSSYVPTYLTAGITALALLTALVFGSSVAYYAIFVLVTWLFCLAVYYTVRMM